MTESLFLNFYQVRPVVEANPVRMHSDTKSWKNRLTNHQSATEYQSIVESQYPISTFSDNQVNETTN